MHNKPEGKFHTGQAKYMYLRSCEWLGSCLVTEHLMMKSSVLFHVFECGPLPPPTSACTSGPPDVIHMISVPGLLHFSPLFYFRVLYWTQTEEQKIEEAWERGYKCGTFSCFILSSCRSVVNHPDNVLLWNFLPRTFLSKNIEWRPGYYGFLVTHWLCCSNTYVSYLYIIQNWHTTIILVY